MGFFTVGNLLTLGIVVLALILYRQLDRRGRSLDRLSKFAEKIKTEFKAFTDEQGDAVSGYRAELKVEQEAAKVLMDRIKTTNEELAEKSAAVERLEDRLKAYESSMEELSEMTGRVQENLNRIRDESAFVEGAARRITEAKTGLEDLENQLGSLEIRFERDNTESLEKTAESVIAAVRSAVSDLEANAETIERQVDEHREAVNKIEQERAANLARDMEIVNKTLKTAVEQAGLRADRMEEAALVKLKEQAQERVRRLQTAEEERIKTYQESARNRVAETQGLVKTFREDWRAERQEWEAKDKALRDEWKKDLQEMKNAVADQEAQLVKVSEEMKRKALEVTGVRLEEYRQAQDGEFKRLEALTEDSRKLDAELRRNMQAVTAKVRDEFGLFQTESDNARKAAAAEFGSAVSALKAEMEGVEKELNGLKNQAYQNVSEKLQVFEDDFFTDLARRSADIERRLSEWQDNLETKLKALGEDAETKRLDLESSLGDEMKKALVSQGDKLLTDLERLKIESGAFEESIRGRMNAADDSLASYKSELDHSLEDARESAELTIKAEIGNYALATAETIKQNQRELEGKLRDISAYVENRNTELSEILDASRQNISELDTRITQVRSSIEDA
jgi:DNA repair exonuclease SbcCD ATPase subunit